jgi:hypothetical protein
MAEKTVLVCDVCGDEPAHSVALRIGGANWQKDLCEDHMTELLNGARRPRRGVRPGGGNRGRATRPAQKATTKKKTTRGRKTGTRRTRRPGTNQDVPAQMRKLRASGLSYRQIGEALIKGGIKPQRAKAWNPVVIGRLLKRAAA